MIYSIDFTIAINRLQGGLIMHKSVLTEEIKTWILSVKKSWCKWKVVIE